MTDDQVATMKQGHGMKKYILTGTPLMILANLLDSQGIKLDLTSLEPIEPLSGEQIDTLLVQHGKGDDGFHAFAHAIERRILGDVDAQTLLDEGLNASKGESKSKGTP